MEKQLKCFRLLSLKEICLRRVAVLLWSGPDILASISEFSPTSSFARKEEEWRRTLFNKIKYKMLKLELPESLKNQMIELIGSMSFEVKEWRASRQGVIWALNNKIDLSNPAKPCWTTAGTINYRKTTEELFRCFKLDVVQRFEIACHYCLENRISLYWEELPEKDKGIYLRKGYRLTDLADFWPYILKGEHSYLDNLAYNRNLTSFNQFAFEDSAKKGNKAAAEYFFQKLSHEERDASLMKTAHAVMARCNFYGNEALSNIFYLLSLMTPEQQMEIIMAYPIDVFACFLRSQLQDLFRENAGLLWALFPPSKYISLLMKIPHCYEFVYFPKMFKELFIESPRDFKRCLDGETSLGFPKTPADHFLHDFFRCEDPESINALFRNVDAAIRVKLVRRNIFLFYVYMSKGKWHLVELCLREATLSREEKGSLKDDLPVYILRELENPRFKRFFKFLDETDASSDQRKKGQKRKLENWSPQ